MYQQLKKHKDVDIQMLHVADLELKFCVGCGFCYKNGECVYKDDLESLLYSIAEADGVISEINSLCYNVI